MLPSRKPGGIVAVTSYHQDLWGKEQTLCLLIVTLTNNFLQNKHRGVRSRLSCLREPRIKTYTTQNYGTFDTNPDLLKHAAKKPLSR